MLTLSRDIFIAAIETAITRSSKTNFLTDEEYEALREVGRTAEEIRLRSFKCCPMTLAGISVKDPNTDFRVDWVFLNVYDSLIDEALGIRDGGEIVREKFTFYPVDEPVSIT